MESHDHKHEQADRIEQKPQRDVKVAGVEPGCRVLNGCFHIPVADEEKQGATEGKRNRSEGETGRKPGPGPRHDHDHDEREEGRQSRQQGGQQSRIFGPEGGHRSTLSSHNRVNCRLRKQHLSPRRARKDFFVCLRG